MDNVNTTIAAKGKVTRTYREDGKNLVELDMWVENEEGKVTTPGSALLSLPSKTG